jgi:hypothetical protein
MPLFTDLPQEGSVILLGRKLVKNRQKKQATRKRLGMHVLLIEVKEQ